MSRRPRADVIELTAEPAPPPDDRGGSEAEEPRARRPQAAPVRGRPSQRRRLIATLASPVGLRQAFLLQEILGPPTALRGPDDRHRP